MNKEAQEIFDNLLRKPQDQFSEDDKAFLRARRGYLTKAQVEEFAPILEEAPQEPTEPELTVAQLKEKLTELNVEFNPKAKKPELQALLAEAEKEEAPQE